MGTTASNKVISLNGLGRERSPGQRIIAECRDQLVDALSDWLREAAAPISEELFVLADGTRERLKQTRYLDLRAHIEKDWQHLIESFRRDFFDESENVLQRSGLAATNPAAPLEVPDFAGLQLVADEDLSEHIVIREFSAQLSESCDSELYGLDRRIALLQGLEEPEDGGNPLAPPVVCQALTDACAALGSDAESRLLLLRRLERHLHAALPPIYQNINARLIERGILPDLKRTYQRGGTAKPAAGVVGGAGGALPAGAPAMAGSDAGAAPPLLGGEAILAAMQRLVQARTVAPGLAGVALSADAQTMPGAGAPAAPADAAMLSHLFLTSLEDIQHAPVGDGAMVNRVRIVRDSEAARQVGPLEAVTIDIVAMLFDFIFDDEHIPTAIKALVSRLQIPVLKVAMLDQSFFSDRAHPARRFLAGISGIAMRWGQAVDESDPLYLKLAALVERIQDQFESDVGIFGTALEELEASFSERESEEEQTVRAAADLVIRREREASALEAAERSIRSFRTRTLPPLIEAFATEFWVGVMQQVALEHGTEGAAWQSAREVLDDLAWSVLPKKSQEERLKLISLLPRLLTHINKGLDSIAADAEKRRAFFDALVESHSAALKGEARAQTIAPPPADESAASAATASSEGDLQVIRSSGENGVEIEEIVLVGASPVWRADDREAFRQVSELTRGQWVDFRQEDGSVARERLNWISPQRGILVFSNHRSAKAISFSPEALARQIRDGQASIVRDEPLFERALDGVMRSLNAA